MSVNQENQLKFVAGNTTEPLEVVKAGFEELPFGSKFVVHIKPLISGEDHFMPSPGLEKKIKEENVDIGDKITIEKVAKSEAYTYGYFNVAIVSKGGGSNPITNSPVGAGFAQKDAKHQESIQAPKEPVVEEQVSHGNTNAVDLHELTLRVEKLEGIVNKLQTTQTSADALPF